MDFGHILDGVYTALNQVRINPRQAAHSYSALQRNYNGVTYQNRIKTREGVKALKSLLDQLYLKGGGSSNKLKWSFALHMVADEQASKLGQLGIVTTQGTEHHIPLPQRCKRYALIRGRLSQVYEFGGRNPEEVLEWLLIDDGLISRKRRNTLLDPIYKHIGIGSSFHEKYGTITVIVLAEDLVSLVAPDQEGKYRVRQPFSQGKQTRYKIQDQIILDSVNQLLPSNSQYHQQSVPYHNSRNTNQTQNNEREPSFILNPLKRVNSREQTINYGGNNEVQQNSQYQYQKQNQEEERRHNTNHNNRELEIDRTPNSIPSKNPYNQVTYPNHSKSGYYRESQSPSKNQKEGSSCVIM